MSSRPTNRSLPTKQLRLRHVQPQVLTSRLLALVAAAAFEPTSRALCRLAGNAIPAEFCLVVVRGLAICYPQLFRDPAAPAEDLRRSGRLAGTDAASELWAL